MVIFIRFPANNSCTICYDSIIIKITEDGHFQVTGCAEAKVYSAILNRWYNNSKLYVN